MIKAGNITGDNTKITKIPMTHIAEYSIIFLILITPFSNPLPLLTNDLDQLKKSVSDGKSSIASAITAKGVATNADATFADMATNISSIQTDVKHTVYCIVSANTGGASIDIMVDNALMQRMMVNAGQSYIQSNHFTV